MQRNGSPPPPFSLALSPLFSQVFARVKRLVSGIRNDQFQARAPTAGNGIREPREFFDFVAGRD